MGRLRQNQVPKRRHHKASGQDVVSLSGQDWYLGRHDSPEAIGEYNRLVGLWVANGRKMPPRIAGDARDLTVADLLGRFVAHAERYYVKNGKPTTSQNRMRRLAARVVKLYGPTKAESFGPMALKAVRESWVADGCIRPVVNEYAAKVVLMFSWAVSEELVPPSLAHGLREVPPLLEGRTAAPEKEAIGPANPASVAAILDTCEPRIAALIRLQLLTAMRPGEACSMRAGRIDREGRDGIWVYTPESHKTQHRGKSRTIMLGPKAQAVLAPILSAGPPSEPGRKAKGPIDPPLFPARRLPKSSYHPGNYARDIREMCDSLGVPRFSPNQLRHSALTAIRETFGLEAARKVADHANASTTTIYAKDDNDKGKVAVAQSFG